MLIALDTETTGVDFAHGSAPFFVTACDGEGEVRYWRWPVDPLTRAVTPDPADLAEVRDLVESAEALVFQNAKFDVKALAVVDPALAAGWPWGKTEDCLPAAHALASNQPKDLTSLALQWLGKDIQPLEDRLGAAVKAAQTYCRHRLKGWSIAKKGRADMPSASEKVWKSDTWLPRALCLEVGVDRLSEQLGRDVSHWPTVLEDYANADSAVTMLVWLRLRDELARRGLTGHYRERVRSIRVAYLMEERGVTVSGARLAELESRFAAESDEAGARCVGVAAKMGYDLELPRSGNNQSMSRLLFGEASGGEPGAPCLGLPVLKTSDKTGLPSLDKAVLEQYAITLPEGPQLDFVLALQEKRRRDTAVGYMASYRKFWVTVEGEADWHRLHPNLNPTATDTLRWSCANPNEQNISRQEGFNVRRCFGPAPGREWWSLDAKNIEARLPAYESGEADLIALYEEPDRPPYYGSGHLLNFHTVYPELWDEAVREVGFERAGPYCKKRYDATWYKWCKNGGFAVQYGAVEKADGWGTADRAFKKRGAHRQLKQRFSRLEGLNQRCIRFANKHGYVETIPDRTIDPRRGYPLMCTRTERGRILETVPLNYRIQGSAMWWTSKAMVRCQGQLDDWNRPLPRPDYFVVMQVHDEMVFDFPRRAHPKADPRRSNLGRVRIIQRLMERGGEDYGIPTPVGVEYHDEHWAEGVTL